ncbi:MAG TPA: hypothetical protein VMG13_25365 [Trebonia sp.]|nr:hypothetical protein [Trebonia sp.]
MVDIAAAGELISYAARAQLALVHQEASHNVIAMAINMGANREIAGANLAHALAAGKLTDVQLQKLDEVTVALAAPNIRHTGGLSSLAICLRGYKDRESLSDRVPASWAREILETPATDEVGVLTQASVLLSAFLAAERLHKADYRSPAVSNVQGRYYDAIKRVVEQLIILGYAPPTPRSVEALIMLGTLGSHAFDIMRPALVDALGHPLGFRMWRALTQLVALNRPGNRYAPDLRSWVEGQLGEAEARRDKSLYPGRSLDLELAISIPSDWSPASNDWAGNALRARAANRSATVRERGTAALGLWQRAMNNKELSLDKVISDDLNPLIAEFEAPRNRPDAYQGMQWAAATLRQVMDAKVPVCRDWPQIDEPWMRNFRRAVRYLEQQAMPPDILPATKDLFEHSLLQNAGVYRRHAVETLTAGGWTGPVTSALAKFLELEGDASWIRIRALFALGFLQDRDRSVGRALTAACKAAYLNLFRNPSQAQIHEMHAALFAVGDCFGGSDVAERDVRRAREDICDVLTGLVGSQLISEKEYFSVSRATAYLLTFMVLPRQGNETDLAENLLTALSEHPDETTRELSKWALRNRIAADGSILPLTSAKI